MSTTNSLSVLTAKLNQSGQQRLFEFLDVVDTDAAARFRSWLGTATDSEVSKAADLLNRASHAKEFAGWWHIHDKAPPGRAAQSVAHSRTPTPTPLEQVHSQAYARNANRDLTIGGLWLLGGLLISVVSYCLAASSPGGGPFVIATGAMLYGALRLFRGLKAGWF